MALKNISGKALKIMWDGREIAVPAGKIVRFNSSNVDMHFMDKCSGSFELIPEPEKKSEDWSYRVESDGKKTKAVEKEKSIE